MHPIILGSQSPRRREILEYFSIPYIQANSYFDESIIPFTGHGAEYATLISEGKAQALKDRYPDQPILTADSVVTLDNRVYGKPRNREEARQFLQTFSGNWHSVFTGVTILYRNTKFSKAEETRVLFNDLSNEEIEHYLGKAHWSDKAGAYTIQSFGGLLVKEIQGCYYNVMGFPINTVNSLLKKVSIDLWNYLKEG